MIDKRLEDKFVILNLERTNGFGRPFFWAPLRSGYVDDVNRAAVYTQEQVLEEEFNWRDDCPIPVIVAAVLAGETPEGDE